MTMQHSLDFYVEEIADYGIEAFVEGWANAGLTRLRPTVAYHPVRILSPDNPRRVLLDLEGDVCFLDASSAAHFSDRLFRFSAIATPASSNRLRTPRCAGVSFSTAGPSSSTTCTSRG